MCVCVCVCVCVFWQHFFINTNFVEHNRHFLSTYFLVDPLLISDDDNNIYVGLTSTTLSRRLTMHLFDTSSISQH